MMPLLLPLLFAFQDSALKAATPPTAALKPPTPATAPAVLKPLSFHSQRFKYHWDRLIPLNMEVDGLKINSVFFNRREIRSGLLKGADFGVRAQLEVTNTSKKPRIPGFAVAVFDADNNLLGVGSGGTKVGTVKAGGTETFDLNFRYVSERLPRGDYFVLSLELSE
jgi:hypothetical protein